MDAIAIFETHRRRLFGIAYGILGSPADAEDIVQDAYLRWAGVDHANVETPAALLTTITTRLAIDHLRSARVRRETYVGPWLPEPLITPIEADPATAVATAEQASIAMLIAFERLNPVERAVLVLRDVFDLDYSEIAAIVDRSVGNCRQIASRARDRVGDPSRSASVAREEEMRVLDGYLAAVTTGDVAALAELFAEDVVLWSDGGGKVRAARHLLNGAHRVARHLIGVTPQTPPDAVVSVVRANNEPGFMASDPSGRVIGLVTFDIREGRVSGVHALLNPDKLARIEV